MRYLSGMIAGGMTQSNILGYVAAMDNQQVDRGINAYLLGARSVNPDARVRVRFTGAWYDTEKEKEQAQALIDEGADVLTHHSSTPETIRVAEANGVKSIGYNCVDPQFSDRFLASLVFHWDVLYKYILQDYLKGGAQIDVSYWRGASEDVVAVEDISPLVEVDIASDVRKVRKSFDNGFDVFLGEIKSSDGVVMCREDERISDEGLLFGMDWFVEGVEIETE